MIGFPALASTSMEQGRLATYPAFGVKTQSVPERFPYDIYAVPEISMLGKNEDRGRHTRRNRQGPLQGDRSRSDSRRRDRMSKLIFHSETRQLPGVHIIGEGASELIHIGQAVLSFGGTIDYFIETVFNYPTLTECYKVATFGGIDRLDIFEPDPAEIPQTG